MPFSLEQTPNVIGSWLCLITQTFLRFYQAMMPEFELLTLILFLTIFFLSEFSEVLH